MSRTTGSSRWWLPLVLVTLVATPAFAFCDTESPFTWRIRPEEATGPVGRVYTFDIEVQSKSDIDAKVFLRAEGVPDQASATFDPEVLPGTGDSSTLTIVTTTDTPADVYEIVVFAREDGGEETSNTIELVLSQSEGTADFVLTVDPNEFSLEPRATESIDYRVAPVEGFVGEVTVEVTGLPDDLVLEDPRETVTVREHAFGGPVGHFEVQFLPIEPVDEEVTLTMTASGEGVSHSQTIVIHLSVEDSAPTAGG